MEGKKIAIDKAKAEYRAIREQLLLLGMPDDDPKFKPLRDEDCKAFVVVMEEVQRGDSRKVPSWIWGDFSFVGQVGDNDVKTFLVESE